MKQIILVFAAILALSSSVSAQGLKKIKGTVDLSHTFFDPEYQISYKEVDGEKVYHGSVKMYSNEVIDVGESVSGKQSYIMSANHREGKLDGPMSMTYKEDYEWVDYDYFAFVREKSTSTFSGVFKNGVPNGTFKLVYNNNRNGIVNYGERVNDVRSGVAAYPKTTLSCTYKNGVLVGAFNFDGFYPVNSTNKRKLKGAFTPDGKLTGKWIVDNQTITFLNGVIQGCDSYDDNLKSLAKSLGSENLTLMQLEADYCVRSVPVETYVDEIARTSVLWKGFIDWDILGYCDFSSSNVTYDRLEYLPSLTDKGAEMILERINEHDEITVNPSMFIRRNEYACPYIIVKAEDALKDQCLHVEEHAFEDWNYEYIKNRGVIIYLKSDQYQKINDLLVAKYDKYMIAAITDKLEAVAKADISQKTDVLGCPDALKSDYVPIVDFEYTGYDRDEWALILHTNVNIANSEGVGYKSFKWDVYLYPYDYTIIPEKTFDLTRRVSVPNDYDMINMLLDSLELASEPVFKAAEKAYPQSLESYHAKHKAATYVNHEDLKGTITRLKDFIIAQNGVVEWMDKSAQVKLKETVTLPHLKNVQDVSDSYINIRNNMDLTWSPGNDTTSLQELIAVQEKAIVFAEKRHTIKLNDGAIMFKAPEFSNLKTAYQSYLKDADLSMSYPVDYTELDKVIAVQNKTLPFIDVVREVSARHEDVKKAAEAYPDVLSAYSTYIAENDELWTPSVKLDLCNNMKKIQQNTLKFIEHRTEITENDKRIQKIAASAPAILIPYTEYAAAQDLSWTGDVNRIKLQTFIALQKKTILLAEYNNRIVENTEKINQDAALFEDVLTAYKTYIGEDIAWTPEVDLASAEKILDVQNRTFKFINLRRDIVGNDLALKDMASDGKVLYKLYSIYRKYADLSWTSEVDMTSLNELYQIQEDCKEMLGYSDIKDICKSIKKAKIKDVKIAIEQFRK